MTTALLCLTPHPLVQSFDAGDHAELLTLNGRKYLELTPNMLRRIASAVEAGALKLLGGPGGGGFEAIEAQVESDWERLQERIAGLETAAQVRTRLRAG